MPTVSSPFGLKAKSHPSGTIRPQRYIVPSSDVVTNSGSWANIYQDDAIYFDTNGRLQVTGTGSAAASACVGSFMGVEYADSNGRRTVSNQFNKSFVANVTANAGLGGISDVWFWLYTDPTLTFEIQVSGALPTPIGGVGTGLYYQQNSGNVNAVTGFSAGNATTTAGSATQPSFVVYNLAYDNQPNNTYVAGSPTGINGNSWGDAFPNVLVTLANPQFNGAVPAF